MHTTSDITIDSITKVEGNAKLQVKVTDGKVTDLKFIIADYRRFYTDAVKGKNYKAVPTFLSRICGTCSLAHQFASIESIERALGIYNKLSEQTKILRRLALNGTIIRDHALHLFIFVLPDLLGINSILDIQEGTSEHQFLHDAFDLKAVGNSLGTIFTGAAVHAPYPTIGGFNKFPSESEYKDLADDFEKSREKILKGIELFYKWDAKLIRNTDYIALINDKFDFLDGKIKISNGPEFDESKYRQILEEIVVPYSQSKGYIIDSTNEDYLVGALARLNLNRQNLNIRTKKDVDNFLKIFPSNNIYHNCLAQAIEILHCIDDSIELLRGLKIVEEKPIEGGAKAGVGIGVIEAPRGTLYHKVELSSDGIVTDADVIVPTSQNQINIENDLKKLFEENIDKMSESDLKNEAEKIIRAYDPCMSCATNFLTIKWL